MIVGTAGHIDHGKTTLVRALTGVDTDRLKEEKARGISIELGYAYTPLASGDMLGIVDVPGHEKLVHTMAAGACGIDFALLVVAADDGVMPQTREHVAILQLLGITHGAVALTKVDRVDTERIAQVRAEIAELLESTPLERVPVFETDATCNFDRGVAALNGYLHDVASRWQARRDVGLFRLAIDRVFTLTGQGTVVTGKVFAGRVDTGDMLLLAPRGEPVRVRSIHAQNRPAASGHAGQRCALNVAGIDKDHVARGDWIVDPRIAAGSARLDVELTWLAEAGAPLTHWSVLHIHLATAHQVVRVALLDSNPLLPGMTGRAQLVFDTPVCALPGDRFIVRNAQATHTVGGGRVLDPFAPAQKRRTPERHRWLDALAVLIERQQLDALLSAAEQGVTLALAMRLTGMPLVHMVLPDDAIVVDTRRRAGHHGRVAPAADYIANYAHDQTGVPTERDATLMLRGHFDAQCRRIVAALGTFHERFASEPGPDAARLRRIAAPSMDDALWHALLDASLNARDIVRSGPWLHLASHTVQLTAVEEALVPRLLANLHKTGLDAQWVRDLARDCDASEEEVRQAMRKLAARGDVFQIVRDLFYSHDTVAELMRIAAALAADHRNAIGAAQFRDATGIGRKRAIQVLEFFDRVGYTRFYRDTHVLRDDSRVRELL
jgi:selenocysteine-specific elongation factor